AEIPNKVDRRRLRLKPRNVLVLHTESIGELHGTAISQTALRRALYPRPEGRGLTAHRIIRPSLVATRLFLANSYQYRLSINRWGFSPGIRPERPSRTLAYRVLRTELSPDSSHTSTTAMPYSRRSVSVRLIAKLTIRISP